MKLSFHASQKPRAQKALEELKSRYGSVEPENANTIVVLGGDGAMLRALHGFAHLDAPLYGMNLGTLGFLLNNFKRDALLERIQTAQKFIIRPLQMDAIDRSGKTHGEIAFNEVSLLRETHSSAKIRISVNEKLRLKELVCDGVMICTAVGSTAYNLSAGGPILPLDANVMAMTPISAFRPRRWPGALINKKAKIQFEVLRPAERPVSATADSKEIRDVRHITIYESPTISQTLMFDPDNPLEERIFAEQFAPEY